MTNQVSSVLSLPLSLSLSRADAAAAGDAPPTDGPPAGEGADGEIVGGPRNPQQIAAQKRLQQTQAQVDEVSSPTRTHLWTVLNPFVAPGRRHHAHECREGVRARCQTFRAGRSRRCLAAGCLAVRTAGRQAKAQVLVAELEGLYNEHTQRQVYPNFNSSPSLSL